jgi:2-amino-4-hydroxy-6-hydroxymethyldihydropteridine diphosphokinase
MSPHAGDSGLVGNGNSSGVEFHEAAIGLGSNLGQSCVILQMAWQELQDHPGIFPLALSSPYRSQPVNMDSANWFVNAVALVRTRLTPHSLLQQLQTIEARYGRIRNPQVHGCQDRTLDLDLLLYDNLVLHTDHVIIPHPRMEQRLFVLAPLAEIAGDRSHPLSRKTMRTLCADLKKNTGNQFIEKLFWDQCVPVTPPKG